MGPVYLLYAKEMNRTTSTLNRLLRSKVRFRVRVRVRVRVGV